MSYKKEHLLGLLDIIDKISQTPGNEWFINELNKKYTNHNKNSPSNNDSENINEQINWIIHYLNIDIPKEELFNYSFIPLEYKKVRDQLFLDNIQMLRARYGKNFDGKSDFDEYCRFAHYQIEELLNFFFFLAEKVDIDRVKNLWIENAASVIIDNSDEGFYKDKISVFQGKKHVFFKNLAENSNLKHQTKYREKALATYPSFSSSYTDFSKKSSFFEQLFAFRKDLDISVKMRKSKIIKWINWQRNSLSHRNNSLENKPITKEEDRKEFEEFLNRKSFIEVNECIIEIIHVIKRNLGVIH